MSSDLDELADQLRAVLAAIETGELPAERDQVAWLKGALAGVEAVRTTS